MKGKRRGWTGRKKKPSLQKQTRTRKGGGAGGQHKQVSISIRVRMPPHRGRRRRRRRHRILSGVCCWFSHNPHFFLPEAVLLKQGEAFLLPSPPRPSLRFSLRQAQHCFRKKGTKKAVRIRSVTKKWKHHAEKTKKAKGRLVRETSKNKRRNRKRLVSRVYTTST